MKKTLIAASVAAVVALPVQATTLTDVFTSYYAFGDSLTDDGKFGVLFPPSLEGRFSDGPTYAEYVADEFEAAGLDTGNLALGGATGGPVNINPDINSIPIATFAGQIATFGFSLENNLPLPTPPSAALTAMPATPGDNPLVSLLFGGNDFFQSLATADFLGLDPAGTFAFVTDAMNNAADSVVAGIQALAGLPGGAFDDFLLLDLPDVGGSPAFSSDDVSAFASMMTDVFNTRLVMNLDGLDDSINVRVFDSSVPFDELLAAIDAGDTSSGITKPREACTESLSAFGPTCADPSLFGFADGVHPSGTVQRILGDAVLADLNASVAPVPLPATLPLVVFALGAMGWAGRRRAA